MGMAFVNLCGEEKGIAMLSQWRRIRIFLEEERFWCLNMYVEETMGV